MFNKVLHADDKSQEIYVWLFLYEAFIIILWHHSKFDILYEKDYTIISINKLGCNYVTEYLQS